MCIRDRNNKAETVLQITKSTQDGNISEVKAMHIRDREFDPFAFRINDNALPEVMDGYVFQQPKQDRNFPLTELTEQQHREALENGFGMCTYPPADGGGARHI